MITHKINHLIKVKQLFRPSFSTTLINGGSVSSKHKINMDITNTRTFSIMFEVSLLIANPTSKEANNHICEQHQMRQITTSVNKPL